MKKAILVSVLLVCTIAVFSQEKTAIASLPRVEISGSHQLKLQSAIVGQEYVLQIFLPGSYKNSNKQYPVMYVMDAQWDFPLVTSIHGQQYYDGFIPEMIIVGVTWGGAKPNPDSLRARDYTPTRESRLSQSGGAGNFLSFMKKELIPFIEKNYRADPSSRGLMGCSLGGLFTLFALFSEPGLFSGYVAASPAFGWDDEVIYRYEQLYADKKANAKARLYMSMGDAERGVPGFEQLAKKIRGRNYTNLALKTRILENTGHSGTKAEGYSRGLQFIFERADLVLDVANMNAYVGQYETADGNKIEIKREGQGLVILLGPGNKYALHAASETEFYAVSEFLNMKMVYEGGKLTGFQLYRFGNDQFVRKVIDP